MFLQLNMKKSLGACDTLGGICESIKGSILAQYYWEVINWLQQYVKGVKKAKVSIY